MALDMKPQLTFGMDHLLAVCSWLTPTDKYTIHLVKDTLAMKVTGAQEAKQEDWMVNQDFLNQMVEHHEMNKRGHH